MLIISILATEKGHLLTASASHLISWFCAECAFGCLFNLTCSASLAYRVCFCSLSSGHFLFTTWSTNLTTVPPAVYLVVNFCSLHLFAFFGARKQEGSPERISRSPELLQMCSPPGVLQNYHLQWNPACLLQTTIQSCIFLLCLKCKETEKPLLFAFSSCTAFFILLMRMVGAVLRGTLGQCFSTAYTQRTN